MMWIRLSIASDTSHHSQSVNMAIHICALKYHHERDSTTETVRAFMHVCVYGQSGNTCKRMHNFMPTELHQLRLYQGHSTPCCYHIFSAEAKYWWLQTQIRLQGGNSSDMMADNRGNRHQLNGNKTAHSTL
jgi:hypothetical protein